MKKSEMAEAARDLRAAILPPWLREGSTVWYWRETFCDDELCLDMVGPTCPLNAAQRPDRDAVRRCARMHPVLDSMTVWSVLARFTPQGVVWSINDAVEIRDELLRAAVFPAKEAALRRRPGVIEYG